MKFNVWVEKWWRDITYQPCYIMGENYFLDKVTRYCTSLVHYCSRCSKRDNTTCTGENVSDESLLASHYYYTHHNPNYVAGFCTGSATQRIIKSRLTLTCCSARLPFDKVTLNLTSPIESFGVPAGEIMTNMKKAKIRLRTTRQIIQTTRLRLSSLGGKRLRRRM